MFCFQRSTLISNKIKELCRHVCKGNLNTVMIMKSWDKENNANVDLPSGNRHIDPTYRHRRRRGGSNEHI